MKTPLLVLSLIVNAVLITVVGYLAFTPLAHQLSDKPKEEINRDMPKPDSPSPGPPAVASISPSTAPAPGLWQSPADVQAWLLSANAPLAVRYAVAQAMTLKKYQAAYEAVRFPPGMKRWQRGGVRPTPEMRDQQEAIRLQQEEEMNQLIGADYVRARYGEGERLSGLPAEKVMEINRVDLKYADARIKLGSTWTLGELRLMDEEKNAELRKILTPGEFELHQAYESQDGQQLQRALAGLDIDDETYVRVFRAAAGAKAQSQYPSFSPICRLEVIQAIGKAVGAEVAAQLAINLDAAFREVSAIYSAAGIHSDAILGRYEAWVHLHNGAWQKPGTERLDYSQKALVRSYYNRLTDGLSATGRAEFDRTKTGAYTTRLLDGK